MNRTIRFTPAYDHRGETPNYGQHPMHLAFILRGDKGAIVFDICTGWYIDKTARMRPDYYTVCAHDEVLDPHFREEDLTEECGWLEGRPCLAELIYGFTSPKYEALFTGFLHHGEGWLWTELEKIYKERYDD